MANVAHKDLTGVDLHEPKGVAGQTAGKVYVSDGSNSGAWTALPGQGLIPICYQDASSSTSIDFHHGQTYNGATCVFDNTYRAYKIVITNMNAATADTHLWMRFGTGVTPTYQTTNYDYSLNWTGAATSVTAGTDTAGAMGTMYGSTGAGLNTSSALNGEITIYGPGSSLIPSLKFELVYPQSSFAIRHTEGGGGYRVTGAITAIRFYMTDITAAATGTVRNIASGRFTLYGIKSTP